MLTLNDGRTELWQWDTGRTLAVDADCSQVHFSNKVFGRSIDVDVTDGVAGIPDIMLQVDKDLNVWAFVGTSENGYTKISKTFKVNRRNKPADYVFTPQEQITLKDATAILEEAKDVANGAMETAKKAEASADKAAKIADEMTMLADQVEQNTETATKAKADALTAQTKAEEARNAAETAKKAADEAANSAGTDASAASAAATRAQNAANDAAASLASIQVLYQEMQEYVSQSVQDIQTEGNTQVQRVADEGAAKTAAAKEQADRAQSEADRAEAARAKAEEVVESCIPDDTAVDGKPWTSKKIVDSLCTPFEESGNPVQVYPVENYPLGVRVSWEPVQEGSGDPSQENIRPINGRDSVTVERCGENLFNKDGLSVGAPVYGWDGVLSSYEDVAVSYAKVVPGAQYSIRFRQTDDTILYMRIAFLTKSMKFIKRAYMLASTLGRYVEQTFKVTTDCEWIQFGLNNGKTFNYNFDVVFVAGSAPTAYTPYIGSTTTLTPPETVYGGEVDAVTGEGKRTWGIINNYAGETIPGEWVSDRDVYNADKNPTVGAQVAYRLAEPLPFTATGTQPIPALSGMNTIYTDADGVVVTGAEDPKHTITELKNAIISLGGNV